MIKKSKKYRLRRFNLYLTIMVFIAIFIVVISLSSSDFSANASANHAIVSNETDVTTTTEITTATTLPVIYPSYSESSADITTIDSQYAVLIDCDSLSIIASKNGSDRVNPASLTKIMTLLVACENISDYDDTFTMTNQIIAPLIAEDASRAGFCEGEKIKITDLLYGAVLPSGADATVALADYISGSEDGFVKLMNDKAEELGLKDTHFSNTSGLYDNNHYSTPTDIAVILNAAIHNTICRTVLSTYQYTTNKTEQNPEGILLTSTMFSRMYGTEVEGVTIEGGKTGYIDESRHCLASFASKNGKEYIAVTLMGSNRYSPIYDCFEIYGNYLP